MAAAISKKYSCYL